MALSLPTTDLTTTIANQTGSTVTNTANQTGSVITTSANQTNSLLSGLLGTTTISGLTNDLGTNLDSTVARSEIIRGDLGNVVQNITSLTSSPSDLASALNKVIDQTTALVTNLLGINTPNVTQLVTALNGVKDTLTTVTSQVTSGSIPSAQELTNSLSPISTNFDNLVDGLLSNGRTSSLIGGLVGDTTSTNKLVSDLGNTTGTVGTAVDDIAKKLLSVDDGLVNGGVNTSPTNFTNSLTDAANSAQGLITGMFSKREKSNAKTESLTEQRFQAPILPISQ